MAPREPCWGVWGHGGWPPVRYGPALWPQRWARALAPAGHRAGEGEEAPGQAPEPSPWAGLGTRYTKPRPR